MIEGDIKSMIISLPKPTSVNSMYRHNGHHTYISAEGQAWITEAGYLLKPQYKRHVPMKGDISLYIKLYVCGRYDIDNGNKALFDLFTKCGVWEDDSQIVFLQIEKLKVPHRKDEKVEIEIAD